MDRRSFLKKTGTAAAAAVALPIGVTKLIEGMPPTEASVIREPLDPYGDPLRPKVRQEIGWKFAVPGTKDQYGAVLIADKDVPVEALADFIAHQMAETLYEVIGHRRTLALARKMKRA